MRARTMGELLVDLAAFRPVVHLKTFGIGLDEAAAPQTWVAYPQGHTRRFEVHEAADPDAAVRAMYAHISRFDRRAPTPLDAEPVRIPTAEEALEAREQRLRIAQGMGWSKSP